MKRLVNLLRKTAFMDLEDEHRYDAMAGAVTIHSGGLGTVNGERAVRANVCITAYKLASSRSRHIIGVSVLSAQCFVVNSDMHFDKTHPNANSHRRFLPH
jgi:hypothetical protein